MTPNTTYTKKTVSSTTDCSRSIEPVHAFSVLHLLDIFTGPELKTHFLGPHAVNNTPRLTGYHVLSLRENPTLGQYPEDDLLLFLTPTASVTPFSYIIIEVRLRDTVLKTYA